MDFKSYLKINIFRSLKVAGAVMLFSLLFLSSTINLSAGLFFGTIAFVLGAFYHLPELVKHQDDRRRYMSRTRKHEKEVKEFARIRALRTEETIERVREVTERFPYADRQPLHSEDRFTYMTNTVTVSKLKEWYDDATRVEGVLHDSLSRFEEQALVYRRSMLSDDLDLERIHASVQQSDIPSQYKEVLVHPNELLRLSDRLTEIKEELEDDFRRLKKGLDGEEVVRREVDKYRGELFPLYGNRIDMGDEGTVENDVLIFSERGIYTIEVKNIKSEGNQFLKISKDGIWYTRNTVDGEWRRDENSTKIIDQVNRHVYLSQQFLLRHTQKRISVRPIIVISNDNVTIENETEWIVIRPNQIYSIVLRGGDILDETLIRECHDCFVRNDIGEAKFKVRHYGSMVRGLESEISFIDECTELLSEINHGDAHQKAVRH